MDDFNIELLGVPMHRSSEPADFLGRVSKGHLEELAAGLEGQSDASDRGLREKLKRSVGSKTDRNIFDSEGWGVVGSTIANHKSSSILLHALLDRIPYSHNIAETVQSYNAQGQALIITALVKTIISKGENTASILAKTLNIGSIRSFISTYANSSPLFVSAALSAATNPRKTVAITEALRAIPRARLHQKYQTIEPLSEVVERACATQCRDITAKIARALLHHSAVQLVYASAERGHKQAQHTVAAIADIAQYSDQYDGNISPLLRRLEEHGKNKPNLIMLASEIVYWTGDANTARIAIGWLHRQKQTFFPGYIRELLKRPNSIELIRNIPRDYDLTSPNNYTKKK